MSRNQNHAKNLKCLENLTVSGLSECTVAHQCTAAHPCMAAHPLTVGAKWIPPPTIPPTYKYGTPTLI